MNTGYENNKAGAWSKYIKVLVAGNSGDTATVEAFIVGQLGIHESIGDSWYHAVTHIKSGCIIALFSSGMSATDFATKVQRLIDFDAYVDAIVKDGKRAAGKTYASQLKAARQLRESYSNSIRLIDNQHKNISRKALVKAMQP